MTRMTNEDKVVLLVSYRAMTTIQNELRSLGADFPHAALGATFIAKLDVDRVYEQIDQNVGSEERETLIGHFRQMIEAAQAIDRIIENDQSPASLS